MGHVGLLGQQLLSQCSQSGSNFRIKNLNQILYITSCNILKQNSDLFYPFLKFLRRSEKRALCFVSRRFLSICCTSYLPDSVESGDAQSSPRARGSVAAREEHGRAAQHAVAPPLPRGYSRATCRRLGNRHGGGFPVTGGGETASKINLVLEA